MLTDSLRQMIDDGLAYRHDYRELPPKFFQYLGKVLPCAAIGLLVVYCSKTSPQAEPTAYRKFCRCC